MIELLSFEGKKEKQTLFSLWCLCILKACFQIALRCIFAGSKLIKGERKVLIRLRVCTITGFLSYAIHFQLKNLLLNFARKLREIEDSSKGSISVDARQEVCYLKDARVAPGSVLATRCSCSEGEEIQYEWQS